MVKTIEATLIAKGKNFCILTSRFNDFITRRLLDGALDTLRRHGAKDEQIQTVWVPGSFEMPTIANRLAKSKNYDAIICLGTIIRGSTPHFEYVANQVSKGIAQVSLSTGIPVAFGVITADSIEQAIDRAGTKQGNKGSMAALSAIEMANLVEKL